MRVYEDGDWLFAEGDQGNQFYIVYSGTIALCAQAPASALHTLLINRSRVLALATHENGYLGKCVHRVQAGESFGEIALLKGSNKRTASAVSVGRSEIIFVHQDVYHRNIHTHLAEQFSLSEKLAYLPGLPLFHEWNRSKLEQIAPFITKRVLHFGNYLFHAGTLAPALVFIISGSARVMKDIRSEKSDSHCLRPGLRKPLHRGMKRSLQVGTITEKDVVGAEALLHPTKATEYDIIVASSTMEVFEITREQMRPFYNLVRSTDFSSIISSLDAEEMQSREAKYDIGLKALQNSSTIPDDFSAESSLIAPKHSPSKLKFQAHRLYDSSILEATKAVPNLVSRSAVNSTISFLIPSPKKERQKEEPKNILGAKHVESTIKDTMALRSIVSNCPRGINFEWKPGAGIAPTEEKSIRRSALKPSRRTNKASSIASQVRPLTTAGKDSQALREAESTWLSRQGEDQRAKILQWRESRRFPRFIEREKPLRSNFHHQFW